MDFVRATTKDLVPKMEAKYSVSASTIERVLYFHDLKY